MRGNQAGANDQLIDASEQQILDYNGNGLVDNVNQPGGDKAFAFGGIAGDDPRRLKKALLILPLFSVLMAAVALAL